MSFFVSEKLPVSFAVFNNQVMSAAITVVPVASFIRLESKVKQRDTFFNKHASCILIHKLAASSS